MKVESTATSTPAVLLGTPTYDPAGRSLVAYTVTIEVSGGLQGTVTNVGTLWMEEGFSSFHVTIIGLFSGTVEGLGEGTMALSYPLTMGGSAPFSGQIDVIPGSGTGALAGVTGSGTHTFDSSSGTSQSTMELEVPGGVNR
jgi:hypothetical protein